MHRDDVGGTAGGGRRCLIYADTALDGRPLCRQHLAEALNPAVDDPDRDRVGAVAGTDGALIVDYRRRGDLLRQVLYHLHRGTPDPTTADRLVLAVVPAELIESIEDALVAYPPPTAPPKRPPT